MHLDQIDKQIIKQSKEAGAVFVTWDSVVREAASGITPLEAMNKAILEGHGPPEAIKHLEDLMTLTPEKLSVLGEAGNKTVDLFRSNIKINEKLALLAYDLRVGKRYSWRSVAMVFSAILRGSWGSNQLAGMVICEKAAAFYNQSYMEPPWN